MNAFEILGIVLILITIVAVLITAFEKGPCQPKDYPTGKKK